MTITELLVGTLLISTTLAVLAEFSSALTLTSTRMSNQFDAQATIRSAIGRIRNDVRASRIIGDAYSYLPSVSFPGQGNWAYQSAPSGGWPSEWGTPPYTLNSQTLILQVPVLHKSDASDNLNGIPLKIEIGSTVNGAVSLAEMEDLDTIIYKLVPDPIEKDSFCLQVAMFPGLNHQNRGLNPPQTIAKGIVGPTKSPGGIPEIFSYITNYPTPALKSNPISTSEVDGVRVDIEARRPTKTSEGNKIFQKNASAHADVFTRWNRM